MEVPVHLTRQIRLSKDTIPRLYDIERTLSKCGAFLQVVNIHDEKFVVVVHDSFRQFVTNDECTSQFCVDRVAIHGILAGTCIRYLSRETVSHESGVILPSCRRLQLDREYPLFAYETLY